MVINVESRLGRPGVLRVFVKLTKAPFPSMWTFVSGILTFGMLGNLLEIIMKSFIGFIFSGSAEIGRTGRKLVLSEGHLCGKRQWYLIFEVKACALC